MPSARKPSQSPPPRQPESDADNHAQAKTAATPTTRLGPGVNVPTDALEFSYSRSRGPGGQNVNKRNTRAELRVRVAALGLRDDATDRLRTLGASWLVGEGEDESLLIASDEYRSQKRNADGCLERLRSIIMRAKQRPRVRKKTKPSKGAIQRRIDEKKQTSEKKARRRKLDD
ncbi:MAG: aminoacyl-tRNA hydrolase [Phycisphaeraceae bacterium]|nr:aminoacyl-tRNA hydrolase [Phycisphaerales bacterium]MCB9860220.1 aminoacyl-tRNA hydrolase [Phycisphaeraceae bacterium]